MKPWRLGSGRFSSLGVRTPNSHATFEKEDNVTVLSSQMIRVCFAILMSVSCVGLGCRNANQPAAPVESNLKILAVLFGRYLSQHQGRTPPDAVAFKKFVSELRPEELQMLKVTDVEKMFVSPRDGQPYVVRYGTKLPPPGPQGASIVAYEQTGVSGRRYVAYATAGTAEIDEATFRQLVPQP